MSLENLLDGEHIIPPTVESLFVYLECNAIHTESMFWKEVDANQVVALQKLLETGTFYQSRSFLQRTSFLDISSSFSTAGEAPLDLVPYGYHVVGEVLRLFFLLLPDRLIPDELVDAFLTTTGTY